MERHAHVSDAVVCFALSCFTLYVLPVVYSAHMRELALEALLWFTQLPASRDRPASLTPKDLVEWMSTGGGVGGGACSSPVPFGASC